MPKINLTPEQSAIISLGATSDESFIVEALAGTGKTSTLIELLKVLRGTVSIQAFNKSIAVEIQAKLEKALDFGQQLNVACSTVHSHGLSAFRRSGMKPQTLSGKLNFMLKDQLASYRDDDDIHRNKSKISNLASFAKNAGFGLTSSAESFPSLDDGGDWYDLGAHFGLWDELVGDTDEEDIIDEALKLLRMSNLRTNSIDFDDMIYLPLLHNFPLPTYANVLLDEAQDINATRREMAFRSIAPNGRIIAVGDPNQAIYGFTGADVDSLTRIRQRISYQLDQGENSGGCSAMPLTTCWRCDERIIAEAQQQVPAIKSRPDAAEGQVLTIPFVAPPPQIKPGHTFVHELPDADFFSLATAGDAVLCRLNKPNVAAALGLLRRGKKPRIEGKDLGKRLLYHCQSASDRYAFAPLDELRLDLDVYLERETEKLLRKQREAAIALITDEVEAAQLLIDRCLETGQSMVPVEGGGYKHGSWKELEALVETIFGDNVSRADTITLSSVHKSKGREWPRVFILGYEDYMPFHLARSAWEKRQEQNLIYVAKTRAERTLVYVNGVQSAIDKGSHRETKRGPDTFFDCETCGYHHGPGMCPDI